MGKTVGYQIVFAVEMSIKAAMSETGIGHHIGDREAIDATGSKTLPGRRQNSLMGALFARLPGRLGPILHHFFRLNSMIIIF